METRKCVCGRKVARDARRCQKCQEMRKVQLKKIDEAAKVLIRVDPKLTGGIEYWVNITKREAQVYLMVPVSEWETVVIDFDGKKIKHLYIGKKTY